MHTPVKIYINGEHDSTSEYVSFAPNSNDKPLWIGVYKNNNPLEQLAYFDGYIDEVRIWNKVRTQDELQRNLFKIVEVDCNSNLIGNWSFNEHSDDTIFDATNK